MQSKLLHDTGGQHTFAVILATGDEVMACLKEFVTREKISAAQISAIAGHLGEAHVRPTLEVILTESPAHLRKRHDPESGLEDGQAAIAGSSRTATSTTGGCCGTGSSLISDLRIAMVTN